jgi:hypothetical protein
MDAPRVFSKIYKEDRWHGGSGPGSDPDFCRPLVEWLSEYIRSAGVKTLVDLGCGDFRWMPEVIAATGISYTGLDVVPLESHRPGPGVGFRHLDVSTADPSTLPDADLYWAKDVLQHWPTSSITGWLDRFFDHRPDAHLVVANCAGQRDHARRLDDRWHFAPLEGNRKPLALFRPQLLFVWSGKHVYRLHHRSFSTAVRMSDGPAA